MRITAYTVILNEYDNLRRPRVITSGARYVCFSDRPRSVHPWETQAFPQVLDTPARNVRIPKCLPHLLLDTDVSIFMDGAFVPLMDLREAIKFMGNADVAMYAHPGGHRSYHDERNFYQRIHGYVPEDVERTYQKYCADGVPVGKHFYAGGLVIRRHSQLVERFNELWFHYYLTGTQNDQFGLNRAVVESGVTVATIPGVATADRQRFGYCLHANSGCGDNPKFEKENSIWASRVQRIRELSVGQ
jgi:hypothetical protein